MILAFELDMPCAPSWNGRWSGEGRPHVKIVNRGRSQQTASKDAELLATGSYTYRWSDGWTARVTVRQVDAKEAAQLRRKSAGFCGYDWMVASLLVRHTILADHEVEK